MVKFTPVLALTLAFFWTSSSATMASAAKKEIVFRYEPSADRRIPAGRNVESVSIVGSFNGWDRAADPMNKNSAGIFARTIQISEGTHLYKFLVDGDLWLEDPAADTELRQPDGFGGFNSALRVSFTAADKAAARERMMSMKVRDVPDWAKDAVWYQIFPERFRNGDPKNDPTLRDIREDNIPGWSTTNWGADWYAMDEWEKKTYGTVFQSVFRRRYGGDLQGIIDKLDYLQDLGVTAIYLNPIFRSPSLHKYDGSSLHHVEETFGPDPEGDREAIDAARETEDPSTWIWTSADKLFLKLVDEVHRRGMKIIIDGVLNHSGREFFAFQDILENKEASRYAGWYQIKRWDKNLKDGFEYEGWYGVKSLPEFKRDERDLAAPVKQYVFDITRRWLAPNGEVKNGVDGWRLDVAYRLPHPFWKSWRQYVKSIHPAAYITGEVVEVAPDFLEGDEFDALMNYPFAYAVTEFFIDRKNKITASEFDRRLEELRDAYPPAITAVMQNLMSSHDSARLRTLIVNPDQNYRDFGGHFMRSKIESNTGYRIDRGAEEHRAIHKLIAAFQMTYPGAPMIYYGDEAGMTGANDPDCRKPMLWPDVEYEDEQVHPVAGKTRPSERNDVDLELVGHYKKLIAIRKSSPALLRGEYRTVLADDARLVFAFARTLKDDKIVAVFNSSPERQTVVIDVDKNNSGDWNDLLNSASPSIRVHDGKLTLTLSPRSASILNPADR